MMNWTVYRKGVPPALSFILNIEQDRVFQRLVSSSTENLILEPTSLSLSDISTHNSYTDLTALKDHTKPLSAF